MQKKYYKKIKYILLTILIILILIMSILYIFEKIYSLSNEVKWNHENDIINNMNSEKLLNYGWGTTEFFWLYNDEKLQPKSTKTRILVVGDSYVWGDGYSNANLIWWQQLRNKLLENGYNDIEIVAMGLVGYNTFQEYQMLIDSDIVNTVNPDLIIFSYTINDTEAWQTPYDDDIIWNKYRINYDQALTNILPKPINSFVKWLYPNLYKKINTLLTEKYSAVKEGFGISYLEQEAAIVSPLFLDKYFKYVLTPLKSYLENVISKPYFFVGIPFYPSEEHQNYSKIISSLFERQNMPFYNLIQEYVNETSEYKSDIYKINPANSHPGPKTTEFSARKVLEILENNYSDILGKQTKIQMNDIIINDPMPRTINVQKLNDYTFSFEYPSKKDKNSFLTMPIEENYIKLNFMYPIDLKSIEIIGENIKDIDIYINKINQNLGYDDQTMYHITYDRKYFWNINSEKVTSINIHADIKNSDNKVLTIKFVKE